ncbi:MAG: phosphoribosylanthranilate isomerase [Armatimonadetes bacterium]|nr:phosphoribosylanthranilate isomerase [Armatimonadota bacterium]
MQHPFVKICGMTRPQDIRLALSLGARYVGCVVDVPRSPRTVTISRAAELSKAAPGALVCVVVDMPRDDLRRLVETAAPAAVQLHGSETACAMRNLKRQFPNLAIWRVVGVEASHALEQTIATASMAAHSGADAVLLDASVGGLSGGTGLTCDWDVAARVVSALDVPVILAGGLCPENAVHAAQSVRPAGIDLSSGVEERPGIKSPERMRALFRALEAL